jgi:hypothetical protein
MALENGAAAAKLVFHHRRQREIKLEIKIEGRD